MTANNEIGVIALVPDYWQGVWMPRHQVMSRLAQHFEVVWIEPSAGWRNQWLPWAMKDEPVQLASTEIPGFTFYDPGRWLPEIYRPQLVGNWVRERRISVARQILKRKGCKKIVIYIWRPEFAWAVAQPDIDLVCYHIDDEYQFSSVEVPNDPREVELIISSDLVIIHSPKLLEKKGNLNPHTIFVPNGVDFPLYSRDAAEPDDLASIPRPRIGYIGVIKKQLDFELFLELSKLRVNWSFVFVGPIGNLGASESQVETLKNRSNVHFLGNRQICELPGYAQHMDVCMMCYEVNDYTNYIYPLKVHEYLATGRPVVSAPIRAVQSFEPIVRMAKSTEDWILALEESLGAAANCPEAVESRRQIASEHDWNRLVLRIADSIKERIRENGVSSRIVAS